MLYYQLVHIGLVLIIWIRSPFSARKLQRRILILILLVHSFCFCFLNSFEDFMFHLYLIHLLWKTEKVLHVNLVIFSPHFFFFFFFGKSFQCFWMVNAPLPSKWVSQSYFLSLTALCFFLHLHCDYFTSASKNNLVQTSLMSLFGLSLLVLSDSCCSIENNPFQSF